MDISNLEIVSQEEGAKVHLKDETGEPERDENGNPVTITVAGEYSKRFKKGESRYGKWLKLNRNATAEERGEQYLLIVQAACIIAWDFTANGESYPITPENWKALLAIRPHYQKQVQAAIQDYASFFAKPSTD